MKNETWVPVTSARIYVMDSPCGNTHDLNGIAERRLFRLETGLDASEENPYLATLPRQTERIR